MSSDKAKTGGINYLSRDKLTFGIFVAAAAHALVVFGMVFDWSNPFVDSPEMDVTIVNHQAQDAPEEADFLAQADQQASGTENDSLVPTTDRLADFSGDQRGDFSPVELRAGAAQPSLDNQLSTDSAELAAQPSDRQGNADMDVSQSQDTSAMLARLDTLRQELAKRPRIGTLTSVAATAREDASYQVMLQERIVSTGNRNYPQDLLARQIYGSLRLQLVILPSGQIETVEILQSSGQPLLDRAAVEIARQAGPFDSFPAALRSKYDKIYFIRTWQFLPGGRLGRF